MSEWKVEFSRAARKQYEKLKRSGSKKPSIIDTIDLYPNHFKKEGLHISLVGQ